MQLPESFWQAYQGLLIVSESGAVRFTAAGRKQLAPLLAKYRCSISNIKTLQQFCDAMAVVNSGELERNTQEMLQLLEDPRTTPEERALIQKVLDLG